MLEANAGTQPVRYTAWTEIHGSNRVNIDVDADDDVDDDEGENQI